MIRPQATHGRVQPNLRLAVRRGRSAFAGELVWELGDDAGGKDIGQHHHVVICFVIVGDHGSVVALEKVNCVAGGLLDVHLQGRAGGLLRPVVRVGRREEVGDLLGIGVPVVECGLQRSVVPRLGRGQRRNGLGDVGGEQHRKRIARFLSVEGHNRRTDVLLVGQKPVKLWLQPLLVVEEGVHC